MLNRIVWIMWQHPWPADLHYLSFLKPLIAIRSNRLVVSLISDQGHYIFLYGHIKPNQEGGRKEQTPSSKCKKGEDYMTLLCSSPCICRLSRACILRETSTKALGMLTHLLTALLPSSHCFLLLTVSFSGQLSQADCSLLPSFVNWLSLSSLGPFLPLPLPVSREISPSGPLCGFHAKAHKEILWLACTHTPTQRMANIVSQLELFE